MSLSFFAVLSVVLIITSDFVVTFLVALCVIMTDLALFANTYFVGLTMNPLIILNIVVAVGISVDYSAHIAYAYLIEPVPDTLKTPEEIRIYKAKLALRKMGSSVFHGGFSTFLAILVLSPGKGYIFIVFFRCWFGIIVFGMANGFILLPVMLSYMGPIHTVIDPQILEDGLET